MNVLHGKQQFVFLNKKPESQTLNMLDYFDAMSRQSDKGEKRRAKCWTSTFWVDKAVNLTGLRFATVRTAKCFSDMSVDFHILPLPCQSSELSELPNVSENQLPSVKQKQNYGVGVLWAANENMCLCIISSQLMVENRGWGRGTVSGEV